MSYSAYYRNKYTEISKEYNDFLEWMDKIEFEIVEKINIDLIDLPRWKSILNYIKQHKAYYLSANV